MSSAALTIGQRITYNRQGKPLPRERWSLLTIPTDLHMSSWGKSGQGKSSAFTAMTLVAINQRQGMSIITPDKDTAELLISYLATTGFYSDERAFQRVQLFEWGRRDQSIPFNILAPSSIASDPYQITSMAEDAFIRSFEELKGAPQFTEIFRATVLVLIANHRPITDAYRLLTDESLRTACLERVTDPLATSFASKKKPDRTRERYLFACSQVSRC